MDWGESPLKGIKQVAIRILSGTTKSDPFFINAPQMLSLEEEQTTIDVPGGNKTYLKVVETKGAKCVLKWPDLHLEDIAALQGSICLQQGTEGAGNRSIRVKRRIDDVFPFFELEGLVDYIGPDFANGDYHLIAWYAQLTKAPKWTHESSGVQTCEIEVYFYERADGEFYDLLLQEAATDIPASATNTAATISNVPADAATGVSVTDNVVLTFSKAIQFESDKFTLVKTSDSSAVTMPTPTIDSTNKVVTMNPTSSLSASTQYTWAATDILDIYGNTVTDTGSFTTA